MLGIKGAQWHELISLLLAKEVGSFVSLLTFLGSLLIDFWSFLIELHELGEIELGFLEKFDLSDEYVLEGEDL